MDEFLLEIEKIPWFSEIGNPVPSDVEVAASVTGLSGLGPKTRPYRRSTCVSRRFTIAYFKEQVRSGHRPHCIGTKFNKL